MNHRANYSALIGASLLAACTTVPSAPSDGDTASDGQMVDQHNSPMTHDDVDLHPRDMSTGLTAEAIAFEDWARVEVTAFGFAPVSDEELPRWEEGLRLVTWPDAAMVPGSWVFTRGTGGSSTLRFQPASGTFALGWYAVQVDFDAVGADRGPANGSLPVVDGWVTSRFHVGSLPLVRLSGTLTSMPSAEGNNVLEFQASEIVPVTRPVRFAEVLQVNVNGAPHGCTAVDETSDTFGPSPLFEEPRPLSFASVQCPPVPEGASIEVRLDGLTDVLLRDHRGDSPPRWTFVAGDVVDSTAPELFERRGARR